MVALKSWRALLVREYLEHRIAFVYFPLGIVALLGLSGLGALGFNRIKVFGRFAMPDTTKLFELGYFVLLGLWLAYLAVALFFYFGDAFSADRRNNAMFFWKSMPISDLKVVASKFLAGTTMFPAIILVIGAATGLLYYLVINLATIAAPDLIVPAPLAALQSFGQLTLFALVYFAMALLWYAPFLAWVGGLSTVFGRWSLPLAFVIPGLVAVVENIAFFGTGPRGGYVWAYLAKRWQFGLSDADYGMIMISPARFDAANFIGRLVAETDWVSVTTGLVFAAAVLWLASEYRRRRIA
jgi:ABC-2 type transport system permease protein